MFRIMYYITIFLSVCFFLDSCKKEIDSIKQNNETPKPDGVEYVIDVEKSELEWKGFKIFKEENTSHFGNIKLKKGSLFVKNKQLVAGNIIADMQSIQNLDLLEEPSQKEKLEKHLLSESFFNVKDFPEAELQITKIEPQTGDYNYKLIGNLKIKNITKPVEILVNIQIDNDEVSIATAPTDILREDFGVSFQSPIENGIILNEINIQAYIKAKKK